MSARTAISMLVRFHILWRAQSMKNLLMRYKLTIIFLVLILASSFSGLISMLTLPAQYLIDPMAKGMDTLISFTAFLVIAIGWGKLNRALFSNQEWNKYTLSLPISNLQKLSVDLIVLFTFDFLLWIPILLSTIIEFFAYYPNFGACSLIIVKCIFIIFAILFAQLVWEWKARVSNWALPLKPSSRVSEASTNTHRILFVNIQFKNLIFACTRKLSFFFLSLVSSLILSVLFLLFINNYFKAQIVASSAALLNALYISNVFVHLQNERENFHSYLSALPLTRAYVFLNDMIIATYMLIPINTVILMGLYLTTKHPLLLALMTTLITPLLYLITIYYPQIVFKKFGNLISLFIIPIFISLNYVLFTYFT